jgi:hypothetical protein
MAGFSLGEVAIVEIEIPDERGIKECGSIRSCLAAADQCALIAAAKIYNLLLTIRMSSLPRAPSAQPTESSTRVFSSRIAKPEISANEALTMKSASCSTWVIDHCGLV